MAASEREQLAEIAVDLRAHLVWLRDCGVRTIPSAKPAEIPSPAGVKPPVGFLRPVAPVPVAAARQDARAQPSTTPTMSARSVESIRGEQPSLSPIAKRPLGEVRNEGLPRPIAPPQFEKAPQAAPPPPARDAATPREAPTTLEGVLAELGECRRCKLCNGRKHLVFGAGNPKAELVFVGDGPGAEEDHQGVPFVGPAGQLLAKMIEAMGFARDQVYICNVVKCRLPDDRSPEPDEIAACEPFLKAQLAAIGPKVVVALGKVAAQALLREPTPITRLRGFWRETCGIRLMPTFHPAYLLRQPSEKKLVWADLQQVMKVFGKAPPKK